MDSRDEPERIEIELTSHDPADGADRRRRLPVDADGERTEPDAVGPPGLLGTESRRLAAVGGMAAVIALLIGVVVGRMGAGDVESADAVSTTTTRVSTTTDPDADRDTLPSAPATFTPPTTRPERATTTTLATDTVVRGRISIDAAVPRAPIELVVMNGIGELTRIDVASGATVSTRVEGTQFDPPALFAGDGWVLVPRFDGGGSTVVGDDGTRSSLDLGPWWPPLTASGSELFWRAEIDDATGQPDRFVEVAIDGTESGLAIEFTGFYPHMLDPLGGIVVQATGGFYVLRPDSRSRVTTGQLIALGEQRAVVEECSEQLDCGYFVVDRATGERTRLAADSAADGLQIESGGWWSIRDALSPDEEAVLVVTWDPAGSGRQSQWVLDLITGELTEIGVFVNSPQLAWSPDGGHVYWLDAGRLKVFDRSTGESVEFSEDLGSLSAITVRSTTEAPG